MRLIAWGCLLAAACIQTAAYEWGVSTQFDARGAYPALAVDEEGNAYAVYARDERLFFRERINGEWSREVDLNLSIDMIHRSRPEIIVDGQGMVHVKAGPSYAFRSNGEWRAIDPEVARDTSLAVDLQGNVYLCRRGGAHGGYLGVRKRLAGDDEFSSLPDPDIAGFLKGRNDHVYGDVAVSPADDSIHIVYRHGTPTHCPYRYSRDGGQTWQGMGVNNDDREAPSVTVSDQGVVYVATGKGHVFEKRHHSMPFKYMGKPLDAGRRDGPQVGVDDLNQLWVWTFGGEFNIWNGEYWIGETTIPSNSGKPIGFVSLAFAGDRVFALWEEGDAVSNDEPTGESNLVFAELQLASLPKIAGNITVVKQWDFATWTFKNDAEYDDPYRDVELSVTFTKPDGSEAEFWGFYNGRDEWGFRYQFDQIGEWSYHARMSDGSWEHRDAFQCVQSDQRGAVTLYSENPTWFSYSTGEPLLIRSLHVGDRFFANNWPSEKRRAVLDWVQTQGYNTLSIASHYLNRDADSRGRGWDTPDLWPLDAGEWNKMETILTELKLRDFIVYPFAGFFGRDSDFPTDEDDQELYIRYALARLGPYPNVLFNVAGPEPDLRNKPFLGREQVNRLGRLIKSLDPFGHPISVHNPTGDDLYRAEDWPDYGILQGPKTINRQQLNFGLLRTRHPNRPLYAQETLWSGNMYHPEYSSDDIRKNAYVIHMSGAQLNFGDMDGNSSSGFSGTLELDSRHQEWHDMVKMVWDFFETIPYERTTPRQDLVNRGYCLAEEGRRYLVYLEEPETVSIKVRNPPFRVYWYNARNPQEQHFAGETEDGRDLKPPDEKGDWLVYLIK